MELFPVTQQDGSTGYRESCLRDRTSGFPPASFQWAVQSISLESKSDMTVPVSRVSEVAPGMDHLQQKHLQSSSNVQVPEPQPTGFESTQGRPEKVHFKQMPFQTPTPFENLTICWFTGCTHNKTLSLTFSHSRPVFKSWRSIAGRTNRPVLLWKDLARSPSKHALEGWDRAWAARSFQSPPLPSGLCGHFELVTTGCVCLAWAW